MTDCWKADDEVSCVAKNIRDFLENLTDYFLNIIVNVNFFGDLKSEYYGALPWNTATSKP